MRFRAPWYRDFQETPQLDESRGVHFLPSDEEIAESRQRTRLWIAPYFHTMPVGTKGQSCVLCMTNSGGGVGLDYAFARGLSVNFAVERQAGLLVSDSTNVNGSTATLGGGLRFIHESVYNTVSFLVRPGIVIDQFDVPTHPNSARNGYSNQRPSVDHAAVTLMLSNDHRFTRSFALRSSIGDTIVRYRNPATTTEEGVGKPPYLSWLSHDEYTNRSNWVCETGPVFRF
jgi:hypothetical protein